MSKRNDESFPFAYLSENFENEPLPVSSESEPAQRSTGGFRKTMTHQIQILSMISLVMLGVFLLLLLLTFIVVTGSPKDSVNSPTTVAVQSSTSDTSSGSNVSSEQAVAASSSVINASDTGGLETVTPAKLIALTFDDGPSGTKTEELLDILLAKNVPATFFLLGERVQNTDASLISRISDEGHEIGNHSYDHTNYTELDYDQILEQINLTQAAVYTKAGIYPTLIRPPAGLCNDTVLQLSTELMLPIVNWTAESCPKDWLTENQSATYIASFVVENAKDGDIILMHDLYQPTIDAVETIIVGLKEKGFTLVTVSELIESKQGTIETGVVYTTGT